MPSWPTALGGMLCAGYAATQAQKVGLDSPSSIVGAALRTLNSDTGFSASPSGRPAGGELTVLQGEVDRLHKLLSDVVRGQKSGQGYTVIHTGRGGAWSVIIVPGVLCAAGVYAYARIRGLSVADFFVVTNKSLQTFRDQVSNSMTQLWEEMRKQKDEFLARIGVVGQQQQQLMAQQGAMDDKLKNVSENVDDIRDISNTIEARVGQMDHTINIMSAGVHRANEGIYLLCSAVAEVTRRVGMDNSRLKLYVQATPPEVGADGSPGLRTLLEGFSSGEQQPSVGVITELGEDGEGMGGEMVVPAHASSSATVARAASYSNGNNAKAGMGAGAGAIPEGMGVLYRRDSVPTPAAASSGRGLLGGMGMGGIFGGSSQPGSVNSSGNRTRATASASH